MRTRLLVVVTGVALLLAAVAILMAEVGEDGIRMGIVELKAGEQPDCKSWVES